MFFFSISIILLFIDLKLLYSYVSTSVYGGNYDLLSYQPKIKDMTTINQEEIFPLICGKISSWMIVVETNQIITILHYHNVAHIACESFIND